MVPVKYCIGCDSFNMSCSVGKKLYLSQWLTGLLLSLGHVTVGYSIHYQITIIADINQIQLLSWLGIAIGIVLGAAIQDHIGRKRTLLLGTSGSLTVGWVLEIAGSTLSCTYANRFLIYLAMGIMSSASSSFVGEIANPKIRGSLLILKTHAHLVGLILGYHMIWLISNKTHSYICLGLTLLFAVTFAFVPESPYYHIANGDTRRAEESLKWFDGDADVKQEILKLEDFLGPTRMSLAQRFNDFKKPEHLKSLFIVLSTVVFLYGAGYNAMNASYILWNVDINPVEYARIMFIGEVVAGLVAMLLVDRLGRRALLMLSGLVLVAGNILLGSQFYMLSSGTNPESVRLLLVISLFLIHFSFPFGLSTVGEVLLGELFPPSLKAPASFAFAEIRLLLSLGVPSGFLRYIDSEGHKSVFKASMIFAIVSLCSVVFFYFFIPTTARTSLIDIQKNLKKAKHETKASATEDSGNRSTEVQA